MTPTPEIPYGHKRVYGEAQKGDGIYDYEKGKFVPVKKQWPSTSVKEGVILIRRCQVIQPELLHVDAPANYS